MQEIHIGEICGEEGIVCPDARTQKQRRLCTQGYRQTGEKAGASIVDAMLAESRRPNVPVRVKDRKHSAKLQDTRAFLGGGPLRHDLELRFGDDVNLWALRSATQRLHS